MKIKHFLRLPIIFPPVAGIVPDNSANYGYFGLLNNVNNYAEALPPGFGIATAGTNITLTAAQVGIGITRLTAGASGGFTITLPSTAAILANLGPSNVIPTSGIYAEPISIMNDNVAQTGTLTETQKITIWTTPASERAAII